MMDFMTYSEFLEKILAEAGATARSYFGTVSGSVKPGDPNQVLTEADLAIGRQLVGAIEAAFPDHNIIDEEAGVVDKGSRYTWVIDPIEGTSNFAAGTPDYGIMVGLLEDGTPIAGGIIVPAHQKLYIAEKGEGATCNGDPIHVTAQDTLLNTLVSFGIDSFPDNPDKTVQVTRVLADIIQAIRNLRNSGCEAVDTMYVAEGRYGARLNTTSKIWDNIAPQIICEEAGAVYTDLAGKPLDYTNPLGKVGQNFTTCIAGPALHRQLISIIDGRLDD